jgi:2-keto-4-pentenoate hydratase/2-oxohepta-3-ene-1,7-dioic acid hydratase in catechol pathway
MDIDPSQEDPVIFLKAGSCLVFPGSPVVLPPFSHQVEYELELALQFDDQLNLSRMGLALDMTARDVQRKAKDQGLPWTLSKSFAGSCPITKLIPIQRLENLSFELILNGKLEQKGAVKEMLFPPQHLADYVRRLFPVCPNDLLLTGTPAGLTKASSGDRVTCRLGHLVEQHWDVV